MLLDIDRISAAVVDGAPAIQRELGRGLFENVYEAVLAGRLEARGFRIARQFPVPLVFGGQVFDPAVRVDILVDPGLVVVKAADQISKARARQPLTWLRFLKQPIRLLLNPRQTTIRRLVNGDNPH